MSAQGSSVVSAVRVRPLLSSEIEQGQREAWNVLEHLDQSPNSTGISLPASPNGAVAEGSANSYLVVERSVLRDEGRSQWLADAAYAFDHIFCGTVSNDHIYRSVASPIVLSALSGINSTVFAYGQTGSGKTTTMLGSEQQPGLMMLALDEILLRARASSEDRSYRLLASCVEVYNERCMDLLQPSGTALQLYESSSPTGGVHVHGLSWHALSSSVQAHRMLEAAELQRRCGPTGVHDRSSRSHLLFTLTVESCQRGQEEHLGLQTNVLHNASPQSQRFDRESMIDQRSHLGRHAWPVGAPGIEAPSSPFIHSEPRQTSARRRHRHEAGAEAFAATGAYEGSASATHNTGICVGTLQLVDLAGSERNTSAPMASGREATGAGGATRASESASINKSLLTLGKIIGRLADGEGRAAVRHLPFRESKLTRLLQPSLSGNAQMLAVCTLSPASACVEESLNTLRFASLLRDVKVAPVVNKSSGTISPALVASLRAEIDDLRRQLHYSNAAKAPASVNRTPPRHRVSGNHPLHSSTSGDFTPSGAASNPRTGGSGSLVDTAERDRDCDLGRVSSRTAETRAANCALHPSASTTKAHSDAAALFAQAAASACEAARQSLDETALQLRTLCAMNEAERADHGPSAFSHVDAGAGARSCDSGERRGYSHSKSFQSERASAFGGHSTGTKTVGNAGAGAGGLANGNCVDHRQQERQVALERVGALKTLQGSAVEMVQSLSCALDWALETIAMAEKKVADASAAAAAAASTPRAPLASTRSRASSSASLAPSASPTGRPQEALARAEEHGCDSTSALASLLRNEHHRLARHARHTIDSQVDLLCHRISKREMLAYALHRATL